MQVRAGCEGGKDRQREEGQRGTGREGVEGGQRGRASSKGGYGWQQGRVVGTAAREEMAGSKGGDGWQQGRVGRDSGKGGDGRQ